MGQISFLAVFIGGVGMLNTMLMSVLERTREIGVLRTLGWRRRQVIGMILRASLTLGAVGPATGVMGGLYPAWRATRMRPVEALRYE